MSGYVIDLEKQDKHVSGIIIEHAGTDKLFYCSFTDEWGRHVSNIIIEHAGTDK